MEALASSGSADRTCRLVGGHKGLAHGLDRTRACEREFLRAITGFDRLACRVLHAWTGGFRHEDVPPRVHGQVVRPAQLTGRDARAAKLAHDLEIASPQHGDEMRSAVGDV